MAFFVWENNIVGTLTLRIRKMFRSQQFMGMFYALDRMKEEIIPLNVVAFAIISFSKYFINAMNFLKINVLLFLPNTRMRCYQVLWY